MSTERMFFLCAIICLFSTTKANTPITCEHNNTTYQFGDRIKSDYCNVLICDEIGQVVQGAPYCGFNDSLFKRVFIQNGSLSIWEIIESTRLYILCKLICSFWKPPTTTTSATTTPTTTTPATTTPTTTTSATTTPATTTPTTTPTIVCKYLNSTYELETYFTIDKCHMGYCNSDGSVDDIWPLCLEVEGCLIKDTTTDDCCPVCTKQLTSTQTSPEITPETTTTPIAVP